MDKELKIREFLNQHQLNATFTCNIADDDYYFEVEVYVPRDNYERALSLDTYDLFPNHCFHWHQVTPQLVSANIGDFVLIYNEHNTQNENIGIVTSIINQKDKILYGCSYIIPTLNDSFGNQMYDFSLTTENYGGYKEGFLKVITSDECKSILINKINEAYTKKLSSINDQKERSTKNIDKIISSFTNTEIQNMSRLEFIQLDHSINNKYNK